jgi:mono/diheme cytochrome c family protein
MTHTIVTRVAFGVCALCVGAAALFAYVATTPVSHAQNATAQTAQTKAEPHPGEALYDRHCAGCHTLAEAEGMLRVGGPDLDANAAAMVEFLKNHGRSNDAEDRVIVEFIRKQVK